jgi:hypothetical protein
MSCHGIEPTDRNIPFLLYTVSGSRGFAGRTIEIWCPARLPLHKAGRSRNKAIGVWTWPHTMYLLSKWSCVRESTASVRPSCLWPCYRRCMFLLPTNWSVAEPLRNPQNPKAGRRANDSPPLNPTWLQWIQSAASHRAVPNSHFNIVLLSLPVSSKGSFPLIVSGQTLYGALTCPIFRTFPSWFGPGVHKSRAPCRVLNRPSALSSCHLSDAVSFEESARFLEKYCVSDLTTSLTLMKSLNFKLFIARFYPVSDQEFVPSNSKYFLKPFLFWDTSDLLQISSHRGAGQIFLSSGMILE